MGYTATWAGLATAPVGVMAILLMPLVGKSMGKIDPRLFAGVSFAVLALTCFMRAGFNTDIGFGDLIEPQIIQGIAMAGFFVPLSSIIISGLDPARVAAAAGLSNFARITAGAFGASISVTLWDNRAALHHAQMSEGITPYRPAAQMTLDALRQQGMGQEQALATINHMIDTQAATLSATEFFWVSGLIFLALIGFAWLAKPARQNHDH
jgi:DHA2 family multidrug resistance protein